jgi:hypothetical protein
VTEVVDSEMVGGPSLVMDSFGNPHMAYVDVRPTPPGGPGHGLKYAYKSAGGWVVQTVDRIQCGDISLALGVFESPVIAYYATGTDDLKYAYWDVVQSTALIPATGGSLASSDERTTYVFPQGTFTDTVVVTHTIPFPGSIPSPGDLTGIGQVFQMSAVYSGTTQSAEPAPGQRYTVTVQYTDVENKMVKEESLALHYWDGTHWVQESSTVDPAADTVTAAPNHLSLWAVLGEPHRIFLPLVLRRY